MGVWQGRSLDGEWRNWPVHVCMDMDACLGGGGGERCMMHKGLARSSPVRVVCNVMSFLYYYCMSSCVGLVGGMLNFMNGCMAWSCETGLLLGTHRTRVFTLTLPIYPFQADWLALGYKINT